MGLVVATVVLCCVAAPVVAFRREIKSRLAVRRSRKRYQRDVDF